MGRILAISDLHYGASGSPGDEAVRKLAQAVNDIAHEEDVLCLIGDVAECEVTFGFALDQFRGCRAAKALVLGNHDVWVEGTLTGCKTSQQRMVLQHEMAADRGWTPVQDQYLRHGDLTIVGTMGWSDSSFCDPGLGSIPTEVYDQYGCCINGKACIWGDRSCRWGEGATRDSVSRMLLDQLIAQLRAVSGDGIVVAITHHLPTRALLPYWEVRKRAPWVIPTHWRFLNAFLGSERLGEVLAADPRVQTVISGHVHWRASARIANRLPAYTIGGDYHKKELLILDGPKVQRLTFA